jgi:hypothetical protein
VNTGNYRHTVGLYLHLCATHYFANICSHIDKTGISHNVAQNLKKYAGRVTLVRQAKSNMQFSGAASFKFQMKESIMTELPSAWTSIYANHGYISVSTSSGYLVCTCDLDGEHIVLNDTCSDLELGNAVLSALGKSRVIDEEEIAEFFDCDKVNEKYEIWVSTLLAKMDGMSRKKAFDKMKHATAVVREESLTLSPNRKERGRAWSGRGFTEADKIVLHPPFFPENIGGSLKGVLALCK